jgi:hypothetical protein
MPAAKVKPLTLDNLRARHDPKTVTRNKIKAQFALLRSRKQEYQYELDFTKEAVISPVHLRYVRDEFAAHIATVTEIGKKFSKKVWFPDPKHAALIRKEQEQLRAFGTALED